MKSIRHQDPAVVVGSALGVIVMIALGASFFVAHANANAQQRQLTAARLELAQLSQHQRAIPKPTGPITPITPIVPAPAVTGQEASWLSAVSTNLSQRIAWDRILREVSLVIPDDVTLVQMTMTAPTAASAAQLQEPVVRRRLRDPGLRLLIRQRRPAPFPARARARSFGRRAHEHELRRARLRRGSGGGRPVQHHSPGE